MTKAVAVRPGEVRIVGGQWRSRRLPVPHAPHIEGLRPTPDRVRETLFNWLGQNLTGWHCLDAFAGTGALGFEAASRGAHSVCLVEQSRELVTHLQAVVKQLQAKTVTVVRGDGLAVLRQWAGRSDLDLVFLDPPYDSPVYAEALVLAAAALKPDGLIYLEARQEWQASSLEKAMAAATTGPVWRVLRHLKAGQVHAHLLQRETVPAGA